MKHTPWLTVLEYLQYGDLRGVLIVSFFFLKYQFLKIVFFWGCLNHTLFLCSSSFCRTTGCQGEGSGLDADRAAELDGPARFGHGVHGSQGV